MIKQETKKKIKKTTLKKKKKIELISLLIIIVVCFHEIKTNLIREFFKITIFCKMFIKNRTFALTRLLLISSPMLISKE